MGEFVRLTNRSSARVRDKVPSCCSSLRSAQLSRWVPLKELTWLIAKESPLAVAFAEPCDTR